MCAAPSSGRSAVQPQQILFLDGGLGTTLEDVFHKDISTPLWSSKPIDEEPEVIISAHMAFLRAGSDVILTSTYQSAFSTFERTGYSREDATRIMLKSVRLADEARRRFLEVDHDARSARKPRKIRIALSLGPFGATLSPAQEFDGFYPPPYGPGGFSPSAKNYNAFGESEEERAKEHAAVDALMEFHLERLRVFAGDKEIWEVVDFLAFETVPLAREIKAIRRAVGALQRELATPEVSKPWWISTVYPDGRYPEERTRGGERLSVQQVVAAALEHNVEIKDTVAAFAEPTPWGLGINCTDVNFLPRLLRELGGAVGDICRSTRQSWPWLVVYPNRGDVYDPITQSWSRQHTEGEQWATKLWASVRDAVDQGAWQGLVIGGCCKTGPEEIAALVAGVLSRIRGRVHSIIY